MRSIPTRPQELRSSQQKYYVNIVNGSWCSSTCSTLRSHLPGYDDCYISSARWRVYLLNFYLQPEWIHWGYKWFEHITPIHIYIVQNLNHHLWFIRFCVDSNKEIQYNMYNLHKPCMVRVCTWSRLQWSLRFKTAHSASKVCS